MGEGYKTSREVERAENPLTEFILDLLRQATNHGIAFKQTGKEEEYLTCIFLLRVAFSVVKKQRSEQELSAFRTKLKSTKHTEETVNDCIDDLMGFYADDGYLSRWRTAYSE